MSDHSTAPPCDPGWISSAPIRQTVSTVRDYCGEINFNGVRELFRGATVQLAPHGGPRNNYN